MGLWAALFALVLGLADRVALKKPADEQQPPRSRRIGAGGDEAAKQSDGRRLGCWHAVVRRLSKWAACLMRRSGSVPGHIALILDGNRRFALKQGLERVKGHLFGFDKLHEALEWCFDLGVRTVTVYAFSIENFKRPKQEVDTLMALARDKLEHLLSHSAMIAEHRVSIRILGDVALLPGDLRAVVERVVRETAHHTGPRLNMCFPYTSSHEMVVAAQMVVQRAPHPDALTVAAYEQCLFTGRDFPDLLIRTSGETRLSDFLCWQSGHSQFVVYSCLWPEFSWADLYKAIFSFQLFALERGRRRE